MQSTTKRVCVYVCGYIIGMEYGNGTVYSSYFLVNPRNYELDELAATSEPPGSFPERKPSYTGADSDDEDVEASKVR